MMHISIEDKPRPEDCDFVRNRLHEHNATIVGPDDYAPLAIFVRDDTGSIRGGLLGETFWRWLHISIIWVDESDRGQGLGTRLLALAEEEGLKRGCISAFLDSLSFQAPDFYLQKGYEIWGELKDLPVGTGGFSCKRNWCPAKISSRCDSHFRGKWNDPSLRCLANLGGRGSLLAVDS